MGLKVKLIKSYAGASIRQKRTVQGLGLKKLGDERILVDTAAVRGMVFHVQHLVSSEVVAEEAKPRDRRRGKKAVACAGAGAEQGQES
ncbi:MAG: 50S ribosomal protein L30 [Cystobacterineae bacterium]|nr:50S ribosomal protein L30 [Cystobacterineae bacterium]